MVRDHGACAPSDRAAQWGRHDLQPDCRRPLPSDWNSAAPVLRYGQNDALYGFSCASKQQGITCTVIAGAGKGKGFLINTSGVTKVG